MDFYHPCTNAKAQLLASFLSSLAIWGLALGLQVKRTLSTVPDAFTVLECVGDDDRDLKLTLSRSKCVSSVPLLCRRVWRVHLQRILSAIYHHLPFIIAKHPPTRP